MPRTAPPAGPADLVLTGARIHTVDPDLPEAQALAVREGRLVWLGSDADAARWTGPDTEVIDAGGRLVLPGFIDAHNHVRLGSDDACVQLAGRPQPRRDPPAPSQLARRPPRRRVDRGRGVRLLGDPRRPHAHRRGPRPGHRRHPRLRPELRRAHRLAQHRGPAPPGHRPGPHEPAVRRGRDRPGDRRTHRIRQGLRGQGPLPGRPPRPAGARRAVGLDRPPVRTPRQEPRRRHPLRHHHRRRTAELPRRPRTLRPRPRRGPAQVPDRRRALPPARHHRRRSRRLRGGRPALRRRPAAGRAAQALHRRRRGAAHRRPAGALRGLPPPPRGDVLPRGGVR